MVSVITAAVRRRAFLGFRLAPFTPKLSTPESRRP